ncbi:hypothetical protein HPB49_016969 [Dermacentor silvarum]|uniref:Uncharacterized protein n=1 Tax=Dermacentor silvarum TaxID=543639 RepID=A0ACB8C4J7_DERSI|nr:hypothetical protein HPB49_016969 [Dermacentor silvarum]
MAPGLDELREEFKKELKELKGKIERDLRKELNETRKELGDMKKSISFYDKMYEEMKDVNERLLKENGALMKANAALENECKSMKKMLEDQEQRITGSEQYSRKCNVEIKGILQADREDLVKTVCQVGVLVNEPLIPDEIEVCHRVKGRNDSEPTNIIVQLKSRAKRDSFLKKAKKMRLSISDLGHTSSSSIYINEHLCPALKRLLGMTIQRKKAQKWKFVWTRDGKIFARKDEHSNVINYSK